MDTQNRTESDLIEEFERLQRREQELEGVVFEQEQIIEKLRHSENRFRKVFDHSNDAIFLVDPIADEILDCNTRASSMLGYAREELRSLPMSLIHPHDVPKLRAFAETVYESGKGWTDELTCSTRSGETLSAEISASLVELAGRPCMIAMVRETTRHQRLRQANDPEPENWIERAVTPARNGMTLEDLRKLERDVIACALEQANWKIRGQDGAAKRLGIKPTTLASRMKKMGLRKPR